MSAGNQSPSPQDEGFNPENLTFAWGMESLPIWDTSAHFLAMGGVGSGKTIVLRWLMQSALGHIGAGLGHRALVFDAMGTMGSVLLGMNLRCPVHTMNPFDRRGTAWDIAADVTSPSAAQQLAICLIPEDRSPSPFFADAARQLFTAACLSFIKTSPGQWTLRDVLLALQTREGIHSLLARAPQPGAVAQLLMNGRQTFANILSTLATKLLRFEVVAACWHHATEKLSLKHWLHKEGVILLGNDPLFHTSITLINQAMLGCLAHHILRQQESAARRTWIFLDEVSEVGRIEALPALMKRGRSKGVCVVWGMRRIDEIRRLYGSPVAEEITTACSYKTALRTDDLETAAWAEQHFGPPLTASGLMSLPPIGPEHGYTAFHHTQRAGTYVAHKSWEWVLAHLLPPTNRTPDQDSRPESDHYLQEWTDEDYLRLGLEKPPSTGPSTPPK